MAGRNGIGCPRVPGCSLVSLTSGCSLAEHPLVLGIRVLEIALVEVFSSVVVELPGWFYSLWYLVVGVSEVVVNGWCAPILTVPVFMVLGVPLLLRDHLLVKIRGSVGVRNRSPSVIVIVLVHKGALVNALRLPFGTVRPSLVSASRP